MAVAEGASTPAVVRSASNSTATSLTTAAFTPPAESLIVAVWQYNGSQFAVLPPINVSDSVGNRWELKAMNPGPANTNVVTGVWVRYFRESPGSITVTGTRANADGCCMQLAVRVLADAHPVQNGAASAIFSTTTNGGQKALTTTTAGALVYVASADPLNDPYVANAATTNLDLWIDATFQMVNAFGRGTALVGTPGSVTYGWSGATALKVAWLAIEILELIAPYIDFDIGTIQHRPIGVAIAATAPIVGTPTSQSWAILSGPADVGTLSTTSSVNWTPTVAGTYSFRISATNASGTTNLDFSVTVLEPTGNSDATSSMTVL